LSGNVKGILITHNYPTNAITGPINYKIFDFIYFLTNKCSCKTVL